MFVHHLVLETFVGLRPEGTETCHHDDDPANNKLANLRWDNRQSNIDDRARNGKTKRTAVVRSDGKKFDQILEAAKGDTCLVGNITAVCKGRRERAGGFGWTYA